MQFRQPFTTQQAIDRGYTQDSLKWAVNRGRVQRIERGVFVEGEQRPTKLERAVAAVVVSGGVATGSLAGYLYELDSVSLFPPFATSNKAERVNVRKGDATIKRRIIGVPVVSGLDVLIDLAAIYDDDRWERVLENVLRDNLSTIEEIEAALPELSKKRTPGVKRIRRVLERRPKGAPPTESLMETLMVQLLRKYGFPDPRRQVEVYNKWDRFVARVDLAYPGMFIELDGEGYHGQPTYDSLRETAVIAATGWYPARITWTEVTRYPKHTADRVNDVMSWVKAA